MALQQQIFVYRIPAVPDCTHHSLVTLCGGKVKERIFAGGEHLLRMLANFQQGQIAFCLRFIFKPAGSHQQDRLNIELAIKTPPTVTRDTVEQLIESGPLAEFYILSNPAMPHVFGLDHEYPFICEILRREEKVKPDDTNKQPDHKSVTAYYCLHPFEPQEDNDFMMLDALLSKMKHPCCVDILVSPVNQTDDIACQYSYLRKLISINDLGMHFRDDSSYEDGIRATVITPDQKKDLMAEEFARQHQQLHEELRKPLLQFNIKAFATTSENALMLASAMAESGLCGGKYQLLSYDSSSSQELVAESRNASENLTHTIRPLYPNMWNHELSDGYKGLMRLSRLATVDELKAVVRLPVGGHGSPRCIRKKTDPSGINESVSILLGDDQESGEHTRKYDRKNLATMFSSQNSSIPECRLPLSMLCKHMFVAGVPGSGKTTAVFNILVQLFANGIPFLVIEPAKTEYRILKTLGSHKDPLIRKLARTIRVYTPGNDTISPMRFNPLEYPEGISLDEHISQVLACFDAALPMGGPLQAMIAEAVEEIYAQNHKEKFPCMTNLLTAAQAIMERKKYAGEVRSNLQAAMEVRVGLLTKRAMGRIFSSAVSMPDIETLLRYPTIIEMDYLSQEHACLLTLFILSAIREQIKTETRRRTQGLYHVTVIEEAHNIVGRTGSAKASEGIADPKAFAAQYVSRMLAEMRALGEAIIIADQLPSAVAGEVVKNTTTKLAHRLVSNDDRQDIGGAMLLGEVEIEEIARLNVGNAYFYTEKLHKPRLTKCLNATEYLGLGAFPDAATLRRLIEKKKWRVQPTPQQRDSISDTIRQILDDADTMIDKYQGFRQECHEQMQTLLNPKLNKNDTYEHDLTRLRKECHKFAAEIKSVLYNFETQIVNLGDMSADESSADRIKFWNNCKRVSLLELEIDFHKVESQLPQNT